MRPKYVRILACPCVFWMAVEPMHKENIYVGWTSVEYLRQTKSIDVQISSALGPVSSMTTGLYCFTYQPTMVAILAILELSMQHNRR